MQIFLMILWIFYLFMIGATFASFFNVVGIRTADHVSINRRSHCPKCDNTLRWIDIMPIFGWLINRGKCHFCKEPIHIKYLLIEILVPDIANIDLLYEICANSINIEVNINPIE